MDGIEVTGLGVARRKALWFEVSAVSCVTWLPYLVMSALIPRSEGRTMRPGLSALEWGLVSVGHLLPVLYVMWASGDGFRRFALRVPNLQDIPIFIGVLVLNAFGFVASRRSPFPHESVQDLRSSWWLGIILYAVAASALSEIVYRAYFQARLSELTRSGLGGLLIASGFFALSSGSLQWNVLLYVFGSGLISGLICRWKNCVWPLVAGHVLYLILLGLWPCVCSRARNNALALTGGRRFGSKLSPYQE